MGRWMKTTVEISKALLKLAKAVATREETTLRALIEEGLRLALARRQNGAPFVLTDASVPGQGLQPGITDGDWTAVRDAIYSGRGS